MADGQLDIKELLLYRVSVVVSIQLGYYTIERTCNWIFHIPFHIHQQSINIQRLSKNRSWWVYRRKGGKRLSHRLLPCAKKMMAISFIFSSQTGDDLATGIETSVTSVLYLAGLRADRIMSGAGRAFYQKIEAAVGGKRSRVTLYGALHFRRPEKVAWIPTASAAPRLYLCAVY